MHARPQSLVKYMNFIMTLNLEGKLNVASLTINLYLQKFVEIHSVTCAVQC